MKVLRFSLALVAFTVFTLATAINISQSEPAQNQKPETIVLNEKSTVTFRGVVTQAKVAEVQRELLQKSRALPKEATIYLVLDTPGGDVIAGNNLLDFIKALPQKVKTITVFAASMGFHFAQSLDERLILQHGTLMSHRASLRGLGGEIPGELITMINYFLRMSVRMDTAVAERMGITVGEYQDMIRDEYWVDGEDAIEQNAADRIVHVSCDESLDGEVTLEIGNFLGIPIMGKMSKCPVISGILEVGPSEEHAKASSPENRAQAILFGQTYRNNRSEFVREYILTGKACPTRKQ